MARNDWFANCGGYRPAHDVARLRAGIAQGRLDTRDEYGMTALCLAASSGWLAGVQELLRAGANTSLSHLRTASTPLHLAVQQRHTAVIEALLAAGANPDAGNYWGLTPRTIAPDLFAHVPPRPVTMPEPHIQNAEHLADHYHPRFKIPSRRERESLKPGKAVNLYVYGPTSEAKQDTVKVRITARNGKRPNVRYVATVETPIEQTHLAPGTTEVEFGPEHVATVFVPR